MRRRRDLLLPLGPPYIVAPIALVGLLFDSADALGYLGIMLFMVIHLLAVIVIYLHKIMYGEDGNDDG